MRLLRPDQRTRERRRGASIVAVVVISAVLVVIAAAALTVTASSIEEVEFERAEMQALYMAETGISAAIARVAESRQSGLAVPAGIGAPGGEVQRVDGSFWGSVADNGDDTFTLFAFGRSGTSSRALEAVIEPIPPGPFEYSMFAGNFSGDSLYDMELGGTGAEADLIDGDVYSGADITLSGDSAITGSISAGGSIFGGTGETGVEQPVPEVLFLDFEAYHDVNVAVNFLGSTRTSDDAGGDADQLPASDPAHIFRRNPSDRQGDIDSTAKDDYFLEDPYETVGIDVDQDGTDPYQVSLPASSNGHVYFIDGNLWLHNTKAFSFQLTNAGSDPTQVTFVVKGNVYFSDNLFYEDPLLDGVAFVVLADPNEADSGNIYFGDPIFGTMKEAHALMFAENNFYDNNLDSSGSTEVKIVGNMTAGNQVAIERDWDNGDGSFTHTRLEIDFDERQKDGTLDLPGIPTPPDHPTGFRIIAWREVAVPRNPTAATGTIQVTAAGGLGAGASTGWRARWDTKYGRNWRNARRDSIWSDDD